MNIAQVRAQYPQYQDLSDKQLADALHAKFYSDIPIQDYYSRIGLKTPEKESIFRQVADVPVGIAKGAVQGVRMMADAFGAGSDTSKTIKSAETYLSDLMSAQAKNDQQEISRIMKDAEDKGALDQVKAAVKAFSVAPVDTLSSALGTAAPVIVGALGAKVLGAGTLVGTGVSALMGAGMGAGTIKGSIYEETKNALKEAGASEQDAETRAKLAQEYNGKNLDQILLGTVLGGAAALGPLEKGGAAILARRILGKTGVEATESVAEQAAKGAIRRRVEAGALEAIPEAVQAGQEQVAQNIALQREGFEDVPTFRGAVSAATLEALAGAGLGATIGGGRPEVAPAPEPAPAPKAPDLEAPRTGPLTPEEQIELERQRAAAERPKTTEELLAETGIQTGRPTTAEDIARIRDEHETAVIEGLLAQDAEMKRANELASLQREQQRQQTQLESEAEAIAGGISDIDSRVREGRIFSSVQDLIDRNIPFASTAINDINQKFGVINEAPLNEEERTRIENIMGMVNTFTNFVNLPVLAPKPVDRFAENQAMEALIKERTERGPTEPLRAAPPAPSPRIEEAPVSQGVGEGATLRPTGGVEPSVAEDRERVAPTPPTKPTAFESQIVSRQPAPDGMEVHVFATTDGYGTGLFDADAGQYVNGSVTRFAGADTLPKAEARAAEMLRKATPAAPAEPSVEPLGTRKEAQAFGKAIGATQPYPGELRGRVNLPAQKAAKEGNFQGVLSALEKSKNVIVAEIAKRARALSTKIVIDDDAEETYTGPSTLMRQMSIDGAKMHLEALNKIRALAPQVDALPDKAELSYAIRGETINAIDGGESAGRMYLEDIAKMGHSMFAPLPIGESKFKTKEDFKRLQKAYEDLTSEYGENALQLTSTGSAQITGVAGVYDAATDTIRVPEYTAKREEVLSHEIVHAQTVQAIANPTLRQKPIVARLNKLYEHVKKELEVRPGFSNSLRRAPYGIQSIQEFVAEGMGNPAFQFLLKKIKYENTSAWDSFVQTIANLIGVKRDTAFTELLSIYSDLTTEQKAAPKAEAPAVETPSADVAQQVKDLREQQTKLLTKSGKVPAPRSPARQKYDVLERQIAELEDRQLSVRTQKPRKPPKTIMGSPMLAGIFNKIGGLHTSLLPEFSTRFFTKKIDKKGRPIIMVRNPMIPGYGTLFNKNGKFDFGEIAEHLEEEGYLEPGSLERDYKDAGERAKELVKRALNGEEVLPIDEQIAKDASEREASERQKALDRQEENRQIATGELQLEPEFEWTNEQFEQNLGLDREFETDLEMYNLEPKDLEFLSDEELESELTDAEREQAQARRTRKAAEDAARQKAEGVATGEDEALLTRPTAEGLRAKQEAAEKAAAEEKRAKAAEQERLRKEQQAKEEKARADETVKDFELGKSAEEQMTGMGDLFAASPAAEKPLVGGFRRATAREVNSDNAQFVYDVGNGARLLFVPSQNGDVYVAAPGKGASLVVRTGDNRDNVIKTVDQFPDYIPENIRKIVLDYHKAVQGKTTDEEQTAVAMEMAEKIEALTAPEAEAPAAPPILDTTGIKEVKGRHPQVQAAAQLLQDKKMTREEFEKYVDYYKPIQEVEAEKLLPPTSEQRMNETVNADKRDKINVPVADGTKVGLRMDLPARDRGGAVVSIQQGNSGKLTVGKLISFRSTGWLKDVTFEVRSQEKGLAVATGAAKAPLQTAEGTWFNLGPEETYARVKELMKDPAWKQIGFDPSRHGYFYDRKTREPVVSASEMYQVGQFLLAKNVKYAPKTDFLYSLGKEQTKQLQDFQQTLRNLLNKFGLKDVGLNIVEGMDDAGSYSQQLIRIAAEEANPIRTLRHEAIHALRELGFFTDAQWNSLSKMAKDKWIDQYLKQRNEQGRSLKAGEESRYDAYMREYNGDMEKITEEAVADAFADFDATKPPAGMLQALLKRMKDLFQSIKSALTKIESPEQIFGKVEKGELRAGTREARGEAKSLRDRATANFLRWFGDSKVVDEKGKPLVVYHGSKSDITEFDPSKGAAGNQGMFFTTDIDLANVYGKDGAVYPVYVSIKNPLILQGNERFAPQGIKGKLAKILFPTQYKKAEREQRVKDMLLDGNAGRIFSKQDVELLRREGYDGVVTMNAYPEGSNLQVIVAFDPVQIKSAIGNNGEYSLTNADIRKSLGKTASPGQQALETINRMGMGVKPPEPGRIEKAKAYLKEAGENPAATKESAKKTLTKWLDAFETMAFSGDAAFNNKVTSSVIKDMKEHPELLGLLLEASQSQAVNADNVVSRGIIEGSIEYNEEMKKWQSVKKDENFSALAKKLDDLAKKYGTSKEEMERIAHTYLVVKRLPGIIQRNKDLDAAIEKEQATAKPDRKRIDEWKALKVYVSPEQEAQVEPGLSLIKTIPELKEVSDIWQGIRQNTIKAMVDSGLWSPEYATNMFDNIDYVPYYREEQLEEGAGPLEFIRGLQVKSKEFQLKGSGAPVNDVFDNMIRWSQYAMNRAIRAQKARQMIDAAKDIDIGDRKMAVRVTEEKRGMNIVRVFRDGKQELWDMADPMFVPAFSAIQNVSIPMFKWAAKVADILRNSVVLYPMFSVAQVPQDSFAAMFTSGLKPQHALKIPILAVKEFVKTLNKSSATHNELVKFGVVGARDFSADVMRKDAEIYAGLKPPKGGWGKTKEVLEHIAMAADNAVRQAVYEASVDQGLSKAEALEKAFEIFNVRRRGTSKALNLAGQTIPFFYAYLAAQRVAYRTITGVGTSPTERKAALQTLAATSAAVFTLSMLYAMAVGDDEDYAETPAAVRDRTLTIPGTGGVRIPLRTDFFLFPKMIAEHTYLMLTDKGYEDGAKFRRSMRDALVSAVASPTPLPQIVKPVLEVAINYDFFTGKPVIGQFEKQKDWERQFNDSTSELSKLLGQTGLVSPIAVDHLIRGMFGSAGGLVMYASNFFTSDPDVPRPELSVNEMLAALPGTSGFLKRPQESALKNDFYVLRDEVEKAVNTFNDIKTRSPQGMEAFLADEKQMARLMLGKPVDKINREIAKIRRQMTIITNMPESQMSAENKADNIRQLRELEREMLKSVNVKELREMAKI